MNLSYLPGVTGCTFVSAVSAALPAAPVLGIDDEAAVNDRPRMNGRLRLLNVVARLYRLERNLSWILALHRAITRAVVTHNS